MNSIWTAFCLLLIAGLPSILAYRCLQYPVRYLDNGCVVRNLTVRDARNNLLVDDYSCSSSVNRQSFNLDWPYNVNFTNPIAPSFKFTSFLLVVLDNTTKQLLWMVANITVPPFEKKLTPLSGYYNRPHTIKPYEKPLFDAVHREHQIEFLVFQQTFNFPPYSNSFPGQQFNYPFNLLQWLDSQIASGAYFCGPVAGAVVRIYDNTPHHPPVYPTNYPPPYQPNNNHNSGNLYPNLPPTPPHHSKYPKNAAFRFNSDTNLWSAIVAALFVWYLRA